MASLALLLIAPLTASAGTMTWDSLADDLPTTVRGLDLAGDTGWAVGTGGQLFQLINEEWIPRSSPTTRDLHDVRLMDADHGHAVGADGILLEYAPTWNGFAAGTPTDVQSAYGSTASPTPTRRVEWALPLDTLHINTTDRFGLGVTVRAATSTQVHPSTFAASSPDTSDNIRLLDVPYGTPVIDGTRESAWTNAVHASYATGPVPFTLYLLRDQNNLYALISSPASMDGMQLQFHPVHGQPLQTDALRIDRAGTTDGSATLTHATVGPSVWSIAAAPGSLGIETLYAVGYLNPTTPIAAGTGGSLVVKSAAAWLVETIASGKTWRGLDVKNGVAYLVGSATGGNSGAIMYRYTNGAAEAVAIPTGTYGLYDIQLTPCFAVGSGGTILECNGNLNAWTLDNSASSLNFHDVSADGRRTGRAWASGTTTGGAPILYYKDTSVDSTDWRSHVLLPGTPGVTALTDGLNGVVIGAADQILTLRPHAPTMSGLPAQASGNQGEEISFIFEGEDDDGDHLEVDIIPENPLPPGVEGPDIKEIYRYVYELVWVPPYDLEGIFNFTITLSDGDGTVSGGIPIIIIDVNAPPYWDPHPDVVIPHSVPFTTQGQAYDPDNDPLTLTAPVIPAGSIFQDLSGGLAQLDWTPTPGDVGLHPITFTADDGTATADLDFIIQVVDNLPPIIDTHTGSATICVAGPNHSGTMTFRAAAHDPEGGPLTYTWQFSDDNTIAVGWKVTHTFASIGDWTVTLTVTDDVGLQTIVQIVVRADDCVFVRPEVDKSCFDMYERASGRMYFFDYLGNPANGTYVATVLWENILGQPKQTTFSGTITNGFAFFDVPFDNEPIPLNDLGNHRIVVRASYPNSIFGDIETHTGTVDYYVCPDCDLLNHKD